MDRAVVLLPWPARMSVGTQPTENDRGRSGRVGSRPPRSFGPRISMSAYTPGGRKGIAPFRTEPLQVLKTDLAGYSLNRRQRRGTAPAYSYLTSRTSQATSNRLSTDNEPLITELGDGAAARICINRDPCRFGGGRI